MKILFIFPNINTLIPHVYSFGLGAISAILKQYGHTVRALSLNKPNQIKKLPSVLKDFSPDLVGFSPISSQVLYTKIMAQKIKEWRDIPVLCGGIHATLFPEDFTDSQNIDAILIGEGDESLPEYITALEKKTGCGAIKNFWVKQNNEFIKNESRPFIKNLDMLPFVDRKIFNHQKLIDLNNHTLLMLAGRGCPYNCQFCSVPFLKRSGNEKEYARLRGVNHVVEEIEVLSRDYRFKHIYFRDDTFSWDKEWTISFCARYAEHFSYPFDILTRADCIDQEIVSHLKRAHCHCVWLGIDSGNEYIRNHILKKEISNEQILNACRELQSAGIKTLMTNMVGLPFETKEKFQETVNLNRQIYASRPVVSLGSGTGPKIFVFSPFPGTALYHLCRKQGWIEPMEYGFRTYQESIINMPSLPRKKVYQLQRRFRYLVYKDSDFIKALLFRMYDSRLGSFAVSLIPRTFFAKITEMASHLSSLKMSA